jgi:hypothetical protein
MTVQSFNYGGKPAEAVYLGDIKLWPAAAAPDLSNLLIKWGTHDVVTYGDPTVIPPPVPSFVLGSPPVAFPAAANARVTKTGPNTFRIQTDPWTYTGNSVGGFVASVDPGHMLNVHVPVTLDPKLGHDDAYIRGQWTITNHAGGSAQPFPAGSYRMADASIPGLKLILGPGLTFGPVGGAPTTGFAQTPALASEALAGAAGAVLNVQIIPVVNEPPVPDGTNPLTRAMPALDMEIEYRVTALEAVTP